MQKFKEAFTMVELIFVIVILGILSAIAIPKMSSTKELAEIAAGRSDIASIRSAIVSERQSRLITGDSSWVTQLSDSDDTLFTGPDNNHTLLMYGIAKGTTDGHWERTAVNNYTFKVGGSDCDFTYDGSGRFTLDASQPSICDNLVD